MKRKTTQEFLEENLWLIIKLQARWRGAIVRKKVKQLLIEQAKALKYFPKEDNLETLSPVPYDPMKRRDRRKYKYKSGAEYDGEWRGGF